MHDFIFYSNTIAIIGKDSTATDFYFGCMRGIGGGGYIFVSTNSTDNVTYNMYYLNFVASGIATKTRPPAFTNFAVGEILSNTFEDRFKSIRVQSDQPVSVKLLDRRFISSEFVVLPCHEYQGVNQYEYYTVSTSSYSNIPFSEALLVGCRNNTNITIIPSVDLFLPSDAQRNNSNDIMVLKGNSHTLTLHEGQTLLFGSNGGIDISGTHIISNKPLTVITGHECGSTSDMIANQNCKYMHLQVPPTLTWGKRFILSDFTSRYDANFDYTEYRMSQFVGGNLCWRFLRKFTFGGFYFGDFLHLQELGVARVNNQLLLADFILAIYLSTANPPTLIPRQQIDSYGM